MHHAERGTETDDQFLKLPMRYHAESSGYLINTAMRDEEERIICRVKQ